MAHVQIQREKRALTNDEVEERIQKIVGGDDIRDFFSWILPENHESLDGTSYLVGLITCFRDKLKTVTLA